MSKRSERNELGFLNILVFVLSIYVLLSLIIDFLFPLPKEVSQIIHLIDNAICVVFLLDFAIRLKKAPNKWQFMKWGWIDLISSIPLWDAARFGRLIRLLRIIRVIRAFRNTKHVYQHVFRSRIEGTFTSVVIFAVLAILFSSIAILEVESSHPRANIRTAEDALWWSYTTITTVGYGDRYPVTTSGRVIAAVLMTVGVGLFGTFTAFVASWFVKDNLHPFSRRLREKTKPIQPTEVESQKDV